MNEVWIRGAAMTRFGKHLERSARDLVEEAVAGALADAEIEPTDVQAAYVGNAVSGLLGGQECIRGQVVLRRTGLMGVPIVNLENSCASSSTALHVGWQAVAGGMHDCVVVVGHEKVDRRDRGRINQVVNATMDLTELTEIFGPSAGLERSRYTDMLDASFAGHGRDRFDRELLALVSVKNHCHGSLNPCAHRRVSVTTEQVLASPVAAGQLTRLMCAPLSDGAACLVLC